MEGFKFDRGLSICGGWALIFLSEVHGSHFFPSSNIERGHQNPVFIHFQTIAYQLKQFPRSFEPKTCGILKFDDSIRSSISQIFYYCYFKCLDYFDIFAPYPVFPSAQTNHMEGGKSIRGPKGLHGAMFPTILTPNQTVNLVVPRPGSGCKFTPFPLHRL